jgi:hypothetical protein
VVVSRVACEILQSRFPRHSDTLTDSDFYCRLRCTALHENVITAQIEGALVVSLHVTVEFEGNLLYTSHTHTHTHTQPHTTTHTVLSIQRGIKFVVIF